MKTYTTKEVALGFGVTTRNINKHCQNFTENEDYIMENYSSSRQAARKLTIKGIRKLTNIIQTQQAREFTRKLAISDHQQAQPQAKAMSQLDIARILSESQKAIQYLTKEVTRLEHQVADLASQDLEVTSKKEYKWKEQLKLDKLGSIINHYVITLFCTDGNYREAHKKAKQTYRMSTNHALPDKAYLMTIEQKRDYLQFLIDMKTAREDMLRSMPEPTEEDYRLAYSSN